MKEEKDTATVDDFYKELKKSGMAKMPDHMRQGIIASRLKNLLLEGSFPEEMNDKLAVFRKPEISECIAFDSIEDISNIIKK